MPVFELTPDQEARMFAQLVEAEKFKNNGAVFGQLFTNDDGKIVCRAHHIEQDKAVRIKMILGS